MRLTVHTVHLSFLYNNFMMLRGEQTVKGEQSIVHLNGQSGIKRPAVPVCVGYIAVVSSHFGSQSPLLSSLSVRLVCVPCLVCRFS
ncbi:hypothetical protein ELLBI42_00375 [Enterobacter ludwigii]|uniref:Uncharacterized protein n=1 Tax=Klebsiella quasipneumoniae TaxID=1463165 RepID=A0A483K2I6_9ENTR|nr:hypothetical protein DMQ71_13190 [Klebsiella quasipneumoniae]QCV78055.1 hypothetical protein ELLBI42_00375 [Enterobacter ludwigii]QDE48230.1 hypothetical protein ECI140_00375 [Enterobacter ludwigii]